MSSPQDGSGRHIAILTDSLSGGGVERCALLLSRRLLERGHRIDLLLFRIICDYPGEVPDGVRLFHVSPDDDPDTQTNLMRPDLCTRLLVPEVSDWEIRCPRLVLAAALPRQQLTLLRRIRQVRRALRIARYLSHQQPDALLALNRDPAVSASMALSRARWSGRAIATIDHALTNRRKIRDARRSYPFMNTAVAPSRGLANQLIDTTGIRREQVHTIRYPVVSREIRSRAEEPTHPPWLDNKELTVILAAGRLVPEKDFPTLLHAFLRLATRRPVRLIVLGKGPQRQVLQDLAQELGIAEKVDFPGFVENPFAFMARASLFVLSSRYEGLGIVLIQAMACGCPVVSTACSFGPSEILEDGRWGELVPVDNAGALADAMNRTLDAPPARDALRTRAVFFDTERAADDYEDLLFGVA